MITEYYRPDNIEEALSLLSRQNVCTIPLAGGTAIDHRGREPIEVVDLQALGLDDVENKGNFLHLGAMVTLQECLQLESLPEALKRAIRHECTYNLRQVASIAGTLIAAQGRSPFTTCMLALDAHLILLPGDERVSLGDVLPLRAERLAGSLVSKVILPLRNRLQYKYVARTPADMPIVCASLAQWYSGRTRLALGGYGPAPILALDGPQADGVVQAAENAFGQAGDQWASAQYRSRVAGVLAKRCLDLMDSG
jgi:putative selenate reductase FAD-binding subunit